MFPCTDRRMARRRPSGVSCARSPAQAPQPLRGRSSRTAAWLFFLPGLMRDPACAARHRCGRTAVEGSRRGDDRPSPTSPSRTCRAHASGMALRPAAMRPLPPVRRTRRAHHAPVHTFTHRMRSPSRPTARLPSRLETHPSPGPARALPPNVPRHASCRAHASGMALRPAVMRPLPPGGRCATRDRERHPRRRPAHDSPQDALSPGDRTRREPSPLLLPALPPLQSM